MANPYDFGPQQDREMAMPGSSYQFLPGTNPAESYSYHSSAMKWMVDRRQPTAGCHPNRWIHELLNNNFTECDIFHRAREAGLDTPFALQHPHRLVINGKQSYASESSRLLSTVCIDCHHHLVFHMGWNPEHADSLCGCAPSIWPLPDNNSPWHHLTWAGSDTQTSITASRSKYHPLLAREFFACTAGPCTFQLTLEVSEPRLLSHYVEMLQDEPTIIATIKTAKQQEPTRYVDATDDWARKGPPHLNTYLKNLLESDPEQTPKKISKRNKKFAVLFGPRCASLFQYLEFKDEVVMDDGVDNGFVIPPAPSAPSGPNNTTAINTYRSFLEDLRAELQSLIHKTDPENSSVDPPSFCHRELHASLGCVEDPFWVISQAEMDDQIYKILGILPEQSKEVIVNAYRRQWDRLPDRRPDLVAALMAVANQLNNEQLSEFAITQSSVFDSQVRPRTNGDADGIVTQALNYLGLQPPNNYSAESLLQSFRQTIASAPAEANTARSMLNVIATAATDDNYQVALLVEMDARMSAETAKVVLGLSGTSHTWPEVLDAARVKIGKVENIEAKSTYIDALDGLADHLNSPELTQGAIDLRRECGLITASSNQQAAKQRLVDWALPVGLDNIGNTCYLNSLLQYLYTVKAVRDIATNFDAYKLDMTDENINERRLGGNKMQMDRGEAVVAQAFVHELGELFKNLNTSDQAATRPSQRLANAVLLSTHSLLEAPRNGTEMNSEAPPLPARPSPVPPAQLTETPGDDDTPKHATGALKYIDNDSTETLIGQDDIDSEPSYEKIDKDIPVQDVAQTPSTVDIVEADSIVVHVPDAGEVAAARDPAENAQRGPATLLNGGGADEDANMAEPDGPESIDKKVLNALEHQTRSSGTDQQDVEEVIGSIINRIQAAIRPSSIDAKTGIQLEKIMETFFVTTVNYTKKFDEKSYQHEISFDRSITAFPAPDGTCSLYDALGRNFDQQILEESKLSRYTAIRSLPPVLHVLIQRSQSIGSKNGNAVEIPETLFLDQYMDAPHDSVEFKRRIEDWSISARIAELKQQQSKIDSNTSTAKLLETIRQGNEESWNKIYAAEQEAVPERSEVENWDFDGPVEDDFMLIKAAPPSPSLKGLSEPLAEAKWFETEKVIQEMMEAELQQRQHTLSEHFEASKKQPYRLHAVICHRGHLSAGHYWVWIHDFEDGIWRKYNDANVTENKDTQAVLQELSTSGEPYYLCYVRDLDKYDFVDTPKRKRPEPPQEVMETIEGVEPVGEAIEVRVGEQASGAGVTEHLPTPMEGQDAAADERAG